MYGQRIKEILLNYQIFNKILYFLTKRARVQTKNILI